MTFWASRSDSGKTIDVHVTYGPISINVAEDPRYLRSFWGELGRLLEAAETPAENAEAEL